MKKTTFLLLFIILTSCSYSHKDPGEVLDSARQHVADKDYAEALKDYKWLFENSTNIESSMFGVKHSYCVNEWRKLGDLYEPALQLYRTELKNRKSRLMGGEADWDLFMEFDALCDYDAKKTEVIEVFMAFHNDDKQRKFTESIFGPIKKDLLASGYVEICSNYTPDPIREVGHIIELHRLNIEREKRFENTCDGESFAESMYYDEAGYLLSVLKKSNRTDEFESVKNILRTYYFHEKLENLIIELDKKKEA